LVVRRVLTVRRVRRVRIEEISGGTVTGTIADIAAASAMAVAVAVAVLVSTYPTRPSHHKTHTASPSLSPNSPHICSIGYWVTNRPPVMVEISCLSS
jgi:hypothetical protein